VTRRWLLLAVIAVAAAAAGPSAPAKGEPDLYALVNANGVTSIARLDPETLQPRGRRVRVGPSEGFIYDRNGWLAYLEGPKLRLIDLESMRAFKSIWLWAGEPQAVAWLRWDRIVVVTGSSVAEVRTVDWGNDKVVRTARVKGRVVGRARGDDELVLLLAPETDIGQARVLVVDGSGHARVIPLPGITAGGHWENTDPPTGTFRQPGLALDATRNVAYVAGEAGVAEVPLAGTATYHALRGAFSKYTAGTWRSAAVVGDGTLAVAGSSSADGRRMAPTGLELVDTRAWTTRIVDPGISSVVGWQGLALGWGMVWADDGAEPAGATGLVVFDRTGTQRFRALAGRILWLSGMTSSRAYVHTYDGSVASVDLETGRVVEHPGMQPLYLLTLQ
jgi:hypothetical protein